MPTAIAQRAALGALLVSSVVGAPPPDVRDLLRPSKQILRSATTAGNASARYVEVDRDAVLALSTTARRIAVDIDAGTRYLVEETRSYWSPDGKTYLWHGRIEGMERGHVLLAATGDIVSANIATDADGFYSLRNVGGRLHVLERAQAEPPRHAGDSVRIPRAGPPPQETPFLLDLPDKLGRDAAGDTQIDVLVAYTGRVRNLLGGAAAVENRVNLAIAEANQAMQNSTVPVEFRLVRLMEVAYPEDQEINVSLNTILWRLRNDGDGYFDDVPAARAQSQADLVSLWIHGAGAQGGVVGIAFQLESPSDASQTIWAYSVVENNFATGPHYSMSHEFGHNMGATHDRNNAGIPAFAYAYGYQYPNNTTPFRTIMAYPCTGIWCPVINYWSNPEVRYQGIATGVAASLPEAADNAQALRNTRALVANFSAGSSCSYSLSPSSVSAPSSGGVYPTTVTASPGCAWTAATLESWIVPSGSGAGSGQASITVQPNTTGVQRSGQVIIGQQVLSVTQAAANSGSQVTITITSNPTGVPLSVDNTLCTTPCTFSWASSSNHTLATPSSNGDTARYVFLNWNHGGAASQTITVNGPATYTANYKTQYRLAVSPVPSSGGNVTVTPASPDGFYDYGTPVTLTAQPASGYSLHSWSGGASGSNSPLLLTMSAPFTVNANFGPQTLPVLLTTSPPGVSLNVDGSPCATPCSQSWVPGRSYAIAAPLTQNANGGRYTFQNWSHGGGASQTIVMGTAPLHYTANYQAAYLLTLISHPLGAGLLAASPSSSDGYYAAGTVVQVSATASAGATFTNWSGDLAGSASPVSLPLTAARTVTGHFATAATCAVSFEGRETTFAGSGDLRTVRVTAGNGCAWSAVSSATWLTIVSGGSGSGPGAVRIQASANTSSATRTATLALGTASFTITQPPANCSYTFSGPAALLPAAAASYTVGVQTQPGCPWLATSSSTGLMIGATRSGTGPGSFPVDVTANPGWVPRPLNLLVSGQHVRYLQSGSPSPLFTDAAASHPFFDAINFLGASRITTGCNGSAQTYCPESVMTRGEMAAFIVRSLYGETFTAPTTPFFSDVPASHAAFRYIQKLRDLGVTNGCTAAAYCPDGPVTRGQMAAFLVRALLGVSPADSFPFPTTPYFSDVPAAHPFFGYIQKLRELGVTSGCTATTYCADDANTRGQMAVFLTRGFF